MRLSTTTRPSPSHLVRWGQGQGRGWERERERGRGRGRGRGWGQVERQLHDVASSSAAASAVSAHNPFVWYNTTTSDDHHRISKDLSYFPRVLSDTQQRTLLNAALERLDHIGSYASRRKRLRFLKLTTDTDTDTGASLSFLPDEAYDFEQVSLSPAVLIGSLPLSPHSLSSPTTSH